MGACPYCRALNAEAARRCATCDRALFTADAVVEGDLVGPGGRYEIQKFLGRGGWGMVHKAFDRKLEESVALKILRHASEVATVSEKDERRFRAEIKLARKVRHPNVCAIHEYGEDGTLRYIAMEFIDGTDIRKLLRDKGRLPPTQALEVGLGAAAGLEAVHHTGVVHRDLKPDNIMIDARGVVRLMDFGIAKPLEADATKMTATLAIVGTPWYMSPEQTRGETLDARSDIYSFGIVLFELFTGDVPFHSGDLVEVIVMHRTEPPPLRGPKAAGLPEAVVPILEKALAKEPGARYGSVQALRLDLIRAAESVSVVAPTLASLPTVHPLTRGSLAVAAEAAPLRATRTAHGVTMPDAARLAPTAGGPPETVLHRAQPAGGTQVLTPPARPAWVAPAAAAAVVVAAFVLWRAFPSSVPPSPVPSALPSPLAEASPSLVPASPEPRGTPVADAGTGVVGPDPRGGTRTPPPEFRPSPIATPTIAPTPSLAPSPVAPSPVAPTPTPTPSPRPEPTPLPERVVEPFPLPAGAPPAGWKAPAPRSDNPKPTYRREDVSKELKGRKVSVLMSVIVSERGEVTSLDVHKGDEPFVMAAVDAVRRWRFEPATFEGEPRPVKILVNVVVEQRR